MKINVTDHCVEQIIKRKKKKTKKSAVFFAIWVFKNMITTCQYKWNNCYIWKGDDDKHFIYEKETWYKFVYHYDKKTNSYTLVTFIIKTRLDREIWKLMRRLWIVK